MFFCWCKKNMAQKHLTQVFVYVLFVFVPFNNYLRFLLNLDVSHMLQKFDCAMWVNSSHVYVLLGGFCVFESLCHRSVYCFPRILEFPKCRINLNVSDSQRERCSHAAVFGFVPFLNTYFMVFFHHGTMNHHLSMHAPRANQVYRMAKSAISLHVLMDSLRRTVLRKGLVERRPLTFAKAPWVHDLGQEWLP